MLAMSNCTQSKTDECENDGKLRAMGEYITKSGNNHTRSLYWLPPSEVWEEAYGLDK